MGKFAVLFLGIFASTLTVAGPTIPSSVPVTIEMNDDEYVGTLFPLSGGNNRIQPLVRYDHKPDARPVQLPWMDGAALATTVDRLSQKDGALVVQMEDGTWAMCRPLGLRVRPLAETPIKLAFHVWDVISIHGVRASVGFRTIEIPLTEVPDRVLFTRAVLTPAKDIEDPTYFLTVNDQLKIPVTVLGFQGAMAWFALTEELRNPDLGSIRLMAVRIEALRRHAEPLKNRIYFPHGLTREWFEPLVRDEVRVPSLLQFRLAVIRDHLSYNPTFAEVTVFHNCASSVAYRSTK